MRSPDSVLDSLAQLIATTGSLPSLAAVAGACHLSKAGVLHHFPTREAMVDALVERELRKVDDRLSAAAPRGEVARTWLALSVPSEGERDLYLALGVALTAVASDRTRWAETLSGALARWDRLLEAELGSSDRALLVRLVGDGLLANALTGTPVAPERVTALAAMVLPS